MQNLYMIIVLFYLSTEYRKLQMDSIVNS